MGGAGPQPTPGAKPPPPQVSVVTKYLFQFGFFPWNAHAVLRRYENKPYFPPRVLGLEKTDSYIKYDLVQLMALFFHRSQLLVSPCAQPAGRHLPTHTPPTHPPCGCKRQDWALWVLGWAWPSCLAGVLPGTGTPASSPPSFPPSAVLRPLGPRRGPALQGQRPGQWEEGG